tara:strand:+ start:31483 stop:31728 length:246 start_codon:yes stop_codon:yes gene_type:complete
MAKIEYLGTFGLTKTYDEPSGIIRRIRDKGLYTIEICNEGSPWREDPDLIRHFWGFGDSSYPISAEKATRIVETWQSKWFN